MKKKIAEILNKAGGVGVLPTDTIYGVVGRATDKKAVARIYKLRKRNPKKPFIILVSSLRDLNIFSIKLDKQTGKILNKLWPGKVSVVLECGTQKFKYLHRGTNTLAFRLPKKQALLKLLQKTGPLVAPSANPEGLLPAKTINETKKYFGGAVDFYENGGKLVSKPSTLISIKSGKIKVLRPGATSWTYIFSGAKLASEIKK